MPSKRHCRACGDAIPYALRRRRYCSDWCRDSADRGRSEKRAALRALLATIRRADARSALLAVEPHLDLDAAIDALAASLPATQTRTPNDGDDDE